jgi:NAD(P)-dependent dehydrogenase (short-subunit alcohol dehydrogenase family)
MSSTHEIVAQYRQRIPECASQLRHPFEKQGKVTSTTRVYCVQADLTKRDDLKRLVEVSLARYGSIDCIINCAADVCFHGKLLEIWQSDDYALNQFDINCVAPMRLVSLVHDLYWKDNADENAKHNRSVVNVSSGSGLYVSNNSEQAFYGASKAALNLLTMYLALELASYSVRVNAICPGRFKSKESIIKISREIYSLLSGHVTGEVLSTV